MSKEIEAVKTEDLPDPFLEENSIKKEEEDEEEEKKKKRKKSPSDDAGQDEVEKPKPKPKSKSKPRVKLCKLNNPNNRCQTYSFKKCYS